MAYVCNGYGYWYGSYQPIYCSNANGAATTKIVGYVIDPFPGFY